MMHIFSYEEIVYYRGDMHTFYEALEIEAWNVFRLLLIHLLVMSATEVTGLFGYLYEYVHKKFVKYKFQRDMMNREKKFAKYKNAVKAEAEEELLKYPIQCTEDISGLLSGETEVTRNILPRAGTKKLRDIKRIVNSVRYAIYEAVLIVVAPENETEFKMRDYQNENLCKLYPGLAYAPTLNQLRLAHASQVTMLPCRMVKDIFVVHSPGYLLDKIRDFYKRLHELNCEVYRTIILFNGHGLDDGSMVLYKLFCPCRKEWDDPLHYEHKCFTDCTVKVLPLKLKMNDYIEWIWDVGQQLFNQRKLKFGEIVFGQCWGHRHGELTKQQQEKMKIVSFTSDDKPYTYNTFYYNGVQMEPGQMFSDSHHLSLEQHAESQSDEVKVKEKVRKSKFIFSIIIVIFFSASQTL